MISTVTRSRDIARDYGDGTVRDILSVDISEWDTPGSRTGKTARRCSPEKIARETWHQVVTARSGRLLLPDKLTDAELRGWSLDPGIRWNPETRILANGDPLLIDTAGSCDNRPTATTAVPNLFLAGDCCRSHIALATMESADEGGRNAADAVLDAAGSDARAPGSGRTPPSPSSTARGNSIRHAGVPSSPTSSICRDPDPFIDTM